MNVSPAPVSPLFPRPENLSSGPRQTPLPVTIVPSRRELRRADPALSFNVQATGFTHFDVIVATDPALFRAEDAHRRTARNFRSSRQDFEGAPIDTETGFYMLPRAFVRDAIVQDPRPARLYYLAVAYSDATAREGIYSIPPNAFADAPFVVLGADLTAASLSHVLGMAVHRLGSVGPQGRVMTTERTAATTGLPRMIGGLPVDAPRRGGGLSGSAPVARRHGGDDAAASTRRPVASPAPVAQRMSPIVENAEAQAPRQRPADTAAPPAPVGGGFVDEDYTYGEGSQGSVRAQGFRDYDAAEATQAYDDGLGPMPGDTPSPEVSPRVPPQTPAPPSVSPAPPLDETPTARIDTRPEQPSMAPVDAAEAEGWKDTLVQAVIAEGVAGRYEALNLDGAFRGRMGTEHPYYQRAHDGLSIGPHQANQDTGELGELLQRMHAADPASFAQIFGPAADQLLDVTTADGPSSLDTPGGRSARVQPVDGRDIWEEPWIDRFRTAAAHPPFQAAMRDQIVSARLDPVLPIARALGFDAVRGQAMLLVMAIQTGPEAAITAARAAVNPFDSPSKMAAVLDALGHADLAAFQSSAGLDRTETADTATHFALLGALRELGADAPVPIPDPETAMDSLVTTLGPGPLGDALLKLRVSGNFRQRGE